VNTRRLDWHALLPRRRGFPPERWLLLGDGPELPRLAVELGLAGSATIAPDDAEPADVVALLHGATERLERAIGALAPGGYLYWEVDRTSLTMAALTPGRARRRLLAAGITPLAVYWVGPGWSRASRYLPIDPPGPIAWYLGTMNDSTGPVSSALRRILRMIVRYPPIAALLVPRFAVVAASEPVAVETAPAALADPAVPRWVRSSPVPPILVTGGEEAWGRITLLAFEPGATAPSAVVKIVRRAEFDEATRHEHEVLLDLRRRVDAATRLTVPEPIALLQVGPRVAVVQDAARGSSAFARMRRWPHRGNERRRDLELTSEWLISLHSQTTRSRVTPGSPGWGTHVDVPLDRFSDRFGPRSAVARLFERMRQHTTALAADLPIVLRHMDLAPWNVLIEGDRVRVIDWEVARDGPALTDLVYASLHWSFAAHGEATELARRRHLRWLFAGSDGGDPDWSSIHAALRRYGRAMGVDPQLVPALVVLTFVDQALDRYDRLQHMGTPDRDPWSENRYVGYVEEIAAFGNGWLTASDLARE
jgi:aminoglycoside phosphotransferase (APT) family kinase protein